MSDSEDEAPDKQLKIIIMGDGASGKVKFLNSCVVFSNHENKTCIFSTRFFVNKSRSYSITKMK